LKFKEIIIFIFLLSSSVEANTFQYHYFDLEEPQRTLGKGKLVSKTKDALFSFDYIEDRADYLVFKFKNLTFGEYTDSLMYVAPLVTGNIEFSMYDINFYYDHFSSKSGVKYKIKF
jgi:hypothetical protein